MSKYVPQPRYSAEHKAQAASEKMPLITFGIYWHQSGRRHTTTGVLNTEDAANITGMMQRALEGKR